MISRIQRRATLALSQVRGWLWCHGVRVYFPPRCYAATNWLLSGHYEPQLAALYRQAAKSGTTVFDIGANIGLSVIPLLAADPMLRVVSVEASPTTFEYLSRTHRDSGFGDRWELVPKAVTSTGGEPVVFTVHRTGGDAFDGLRPTGRADGATEVMVPSTTLDQEWAARGRPSVSLVKIDVEGAELGVLGGGRECLRVCQPVIVTEWSNLNFPAYGVTADSMLDLAAELGYTVYMTPSLTPAGDRQLFPFQLALSENLLLLPGRPVRAS